MMSMGRLNESAIEPMREAIRTIAGKDVPVDDLRRRVAASGEWGDHGIEFGISRGDVLLGVVQAMACPRRDMRDTYEVGILIFDPNQRGHGLGFEALSMLLGVSVRRTKRDPRVVHNRRRQRRDASPRRAPRFSARGNAARRPRGGRSPARHGSVRHDPGRSPRSGALSRLSAGGAPSTRSRGADRCRRRADGQEAIRSSRAGKPRSVSPD